MVSDTESVQLLVRELADRLCLVDLGRGGID